MKKLISCIFVFIVSVSFIYSAGIDKNELSNSIKDAEDTYKNEDYEETVRLYEIMILDGVCNPDIFYNLSVAYYKNNDFGQASLNLERAIRLSPRNKDFRYNKAVLSKIAEEPDKNAAEQFLENLDLMFTLNEITLISLFFVAAFIILLSLYLLKLQKKLILFIMIAAVCSVISLPIFSLKLYDDVIVDKYVVIKDAPVRNMPSASEDPAFEVKAGRNVAVIGELGRWFNIKLSVDGLTGWVDKNSLEKI